MSSNWQVSVYADGEITAKVAHNNFFIQGRQKGQKPQPYGVSRKGRNNIRRGTNGYNLVARVSANIFCTLTTQARLSDFVFKGYVSKWIKRGQLLHSMFKTYVISYELHQSGQMHAHILMFQKMPYDVFLAQRALWADYYGMGVVSFDIREIEETSQAAAGYLAKLPRYMAKDGSNAPRPINGRTHTISQSLQPFTKPVSLPVTLPGASQGLVRLADYATVRSDYYMRLQTLSANDAVALLSHCEIPATLSQDVFKRLQA